MMNRIEEFMRDGENFVYIDLSGVKTNDELLKIVEESKRIIQSYKGLVLYTITNIEGMMFDTKTKKIADKWTLHNEAYVKHGIIIGMDSIKQIMVNAVLSLSGRKNMSFAATREEAVEWILKRR